MKYSFKRIGKCIVLVLVIIMFLTGCSKNPEDLIEEGNYHEAIELLIKQLDDSNGEDINSYKTLLKLYLDLGSFNAFNQLYDKYNDNLSDYETTYLRAVYFDSIDQVEEANNLFANINLEDVKKDYILEGLLNFYLEVKDIDKYKTGVNKEVELDDDSPIYGHRYFLNNFGFEKYTLLGVSSGNFCDKDRTDIAIFLMDNKEDSIDSNLHLIVLNSKNKEEIINYEEENHFEYINFEKLKIKEDLDLISFFGHHGGSGTPGHIYIYDLNNNEFKTIEENLNNNWIIEAQDGFVLTISATNLKDKYIYEIDKENWINYIREGLYTEDGKVADIKDSIFGYEEINSKYSYELEESIIVKELPIYGSYENKDYLGKVISKYRYTDNGYNLFELEVFDNNDNHLEPIEIDAINKKSKKNLSELKNVIKMENNKLIQTKKLYGKYINKSKEEIKNIFGKPINTYDIDLKGRNFEVYVFEDYVLFFENNSSKIIGSDFFVYVENLGLTLEQLDMRNIENTFGPTNLDIEDTLTSIYTTQGFAYNSDGFNFVFSNPNSEFSYFFLELR